MADVAASSSAPGGAAPGAAVPDGPGAGFAVDWADVPDIGFLCTQEARDDGRIILANMVTGQRVQLDGDRLNFLTRATCKST